MQGNFVVDAYPTAIHITDILICLLIVVCVGLITSWIPSRLITKRLINQN
tara:strand:- start:341 stop:490 length:150 start_codon:yes stop_codon:yes gene_type:complete